MNIKRKLYKVKCDYSIIIEAKLVIRPKTFVCELISGNLIIKDKHDNQKEKDEN